ncbi:GNAT family N-acetyltransferase [Candidatus Amarobacter glycogenicus]|uniref:GNAT family N-acetyltransferase n=1 Tax=Candidatus Amarobacter glycogenicus TaxID=3140699 RepID=UPI003134A20E|nr:GNAT family N-acetyltransferase [Dehalococcoidia bacterium]
MIEWPAFSTDEFLDAVRDAFMPGATSGIAECGGYRVRTLLRGGKAVTGLWQFPVYREPLDPATVAGGTRVPYLDDVVVAVTRAGEAGPPGTRPSPFVSWRDFPDWETFLARSQAPPGLDAPATVLRKMRKLERELGPVEHRLFDDDPEVFETLIRWKAAHFALTRRDHVLSRPEVVEFYRELRRRGIFTASSLRAGGRLVSGQIAYRVHGRHLSRLMVYDHDPALRRYSPGSVMQLLTLEASYRAGDSEFDYLMGSEPHKYTYSTHTRWVGKVGREPAVRRMERVARRQVSRRLSHFPGAYNRIRAMERRTKRWVNRAR